MTRRRLLIFEASLGGHFLAYVKYLASAASGQGYDVLIALPDDAVASPGYAEHLQGIEHSFRTIPVSPGVSLPELLKIAEDLSVDCLVVPNGDRFAYLPTTLLTRFRMPVHMLLMADPRTEPSPSRRLLKRALSISLALKPRSRVKILSHSAWRPGIDRRLFGRTPDPVVLGGLDSDSRIVHDVLGFAGGRHIFLLVGVIQLWKNPELVVKSFLRAELDDACLVLAGPVSPILFSSLEHAIADCPGRILFVDRFLSEGDINQLIANAHAVVLAYSTHAPNSTAAKAAALGRHIVAAGSPQFIANVQHLGVPSYTGDLSEISLVESMRRAMGSPAPVPVSLATAEDFASSLLP